MVNRRSEIDGEKVACEFPKTGPLALSPPPALLASLPLSLCNLFSKVSNFLVLEVFSLKKRHYTNFMIGTSKTRVLMMLLL